LSSCSFFYLYSVYVCDCRTYEHVTPMLQELHWLWSPERFDLKSAVLVYRCLHGLAPRYLSEYIQRVADSNRRRLRHVVILAAGDPTTRLSTVDDRVFPVAGSRFWNSLPPDVTSAPTLTVFQNCLKTYLFSRSFPSKQFLFSSFVHRV